MSKRYEITWVPYDTQRPEFAEQKNEITFLSYDQLPSWHRPVNGGLMSFVVPAAAADTFMVAGNAAANMNSNGMTQLTGVAGADDSFGYVPLPFPFYFYGNNFSNSTPVTNPAFYWNTNNVLGFGNGNGSIGWSVANPAILIGNADRRTNTFFYSGIQTSGTTNYMNMLLWAQNFYNDSTPNVIRYQIRFFRSPNYQYVELRINGFGATQGNWNITNGSAYQDLFSGYTATAGTSWVLRSDLNGNNWTFSNNYYINI